MFQNTKLKSAWRAVAIGTSAIVALGLVGCASATTDTTTDSDTSGNGESASTVQEVELLIWLQRDEFLPTDAFAQFEAENPGVTVRAVTIPAEEQISSFLRSSTAGDSPDVLMPTTDLWPPLADQGLLYDMTDELSAWQSEDPEGYADAQAGIAFGTAGDGVTYGVGMTGAPTWLVYRKDWFEDAGISVPTTYDELLDAARAIKSSRPGDTAFGIVGGRTSSPAAKFLTLFYNMGGEHVNGVPQFDSPAGIYLLEYYQTLVREGLAHPDTLAWTSGETRGSFIEGIEGMTMISQNIYPSIQESLEYGDEWAIIPQLSRGDSKPMMTFRAVTALIAGNTEHPSEAAKLVRYLAGPDYGLDISVRYQPSLNAAVQRSAEYLAVASWAPDLEDFIANAKPLPANAVSADLYQIIHDMKQEAIGNPNADAAGIAERAQERLDQTAGQ